MSTFEIALWITVISIFCSIIACSAAVVVAMVAEIMEGRARNFRMTVKKKVKALWAAVPQRKRLA